MVNLRRSKGAIRQYPPDKENSGSKYFKPLIINSGKAPGKRCHHFDKSNEVNALVNDVNLKY